ncbi:nucleoside diphosphate kinase regulator [Paracoccus sp. PAMC 22219]|uniref:nucleoside diphosphate kinase regulator n=1 Tax=Paracoccus sp. PAMC 22219 TaxID=1569209 RepID=UPI001E5E927E|nr:nucleoside diphosphate kinase regulator [Paracoccus sp. PAMC 22219]
MSKHMTNSRNRPGRQPKIILDQATVHRIEALGQRLYQSNPTLADRLFGELGRARLVSRDKLPANVVSLGRRVTYRDEATGEEKVVVLTSPEDADISQQRISVLTPIGVALLGLSEGAQFGWNDRTGATRSLTVLRVEAAEAVVI